METIAGSRCPDCGWVVAPPVRICPKHPVEMIPVQLSGYGSVLSFTTLTVAPQGFKPPLHIAVVELPGGARIFCHGNQTRELKIGRRVAIEEVDGIFYFAHLGVADRMNLFWKRRGAAPQRTTRALRSAIKGFFSSYAIGDEPAEPAEGSRHEDATKQEQEGNRRPVEKK